MIVETREIAGDGSARTATCACGSLRITVAGRPREVHACACLECQVASGSAFTYTSFWKKTAIQAIDGAHSTWRRIGQSGHWSESCFCPTCGANVFTWFEGLPDEVGIPVGAFADPDFHPPESLLWAARRHRWLNLPVGIRTIETQ